MVLPEENKIEYSLESIEAEASIRECSKLKLALESVEAEASTGEC